MAGEGAWVRRWSFGVGIGWWLIVLAALAGCEAREPTYEVSDLLAELPFAAMRRQTALIDFGSAEARACLGRGWSSDEFDGSGRTFVWSVGLEAELTFFAVAPADLEFNLTLAPAPGMAGQTVTMLVNGHQLLPIELQPGYRDYRLDVPGSAVKEGVNRVVLRYTGTASPEGDPRVLAAAWDELRVSPRPSTGSPTVDEDGLVIPLGTRVDYFLDLPAHSRLVLGRVGGAGRIQVSVELDGQGLRESSRRRTVGSATTVTGDRGGLVRLSLAAVGTSDEEGALVVRGARIVTTSDSVPEPRDAAPEPPGGRPDILLYLIDTLRVEHVGCYGYSAPVTPHLDAFSRRATLHRNSLAQSSWTRASVASLFTGVWPGSHGVAGRRAALPDQATTLPELLSSRGYVTGAVFTNPNVGRRFGFDQGFDHVRTLAGVYKRTFDVNRAAVTWLDELRADAGESDPPFFLYLHVMEPHSPYGALSPFRETFAPGPGEPGTQDWLARMSAGEVAVTPDLVDDVVRLYDAEVAQADAGFGRLWARLSRREMADELLLIVLSDHGEEFNDHGGWQHGHSLHRELLNVPLLIRKPGQIDGGISSERIDDVDLFRLLAPRREEPLVAPSEPPGVTFARLELDGLTHSAVVTEDWKFIRLDWNRDAPRTERHLYARRSDPGELKDLIGTRPVRAGYLESLLRRHERLSPAALPRIEKELDEKLKGQLEALGYVE